MMKRIFSVLLAAFMTLSALPAVVTAEEAPADDKFTLAVSSVEIEEGTTTASVDLVISNNEALSSYSFYVGFDNTVMKPTKATLSSEFSAAGMTTPTTRVLDDYMTIVGYSLENVDCNGVFMTVTFEVVDYADPGVYNVTLGTTEGDAAFNYSDENYEEFGLEYAFVDGSVTVLQPDPAYLNIGSVEGSAGKVVDVVVEIAENPGITGIEFDVVYDHTLLTLDSYSVADAFAALGLIANLDAETIHMVGSSADLVEGNGEFVTLRFLINEGVEDQEIVVEIANIEGVGEYRAIPDNFRNVPFLATAGTVTVKNYVTGDINDDGEIDLRDLLVLARYFAQYEVEINVDAAYVNGDDALDVRDLSHLARYFAGYDVELIRK